MYSYEIFCIFTRLYLQDIMHIYEHEYVRVSVHIYERYVYLRDGVFMGQFAYLRNSMYIAFVSSFSCFAAVTKAMLDNSRLQTSTTHSDCIISAEPSPPSPLLLALNQLI